MTVTYLWSDGATGATDTLTAADVGQSLTVTVTAANGAGSASATSFPGVGPVTAPPSTAPPVNTGLPVISGTAQQGDTLSASPGTWTGDTPMTFTYLWSDGTTGATDTLTAADVGTTVSVTVTATNDAGSASATSSPGVGPVVSSSASGAVPCALTHADGADGTNSCWATHTGVQSGTGFTEAQILAGQSTLKHVVGDQVLSTAGEVVKDEWIDGCVEIAAPNVTLEDSLIHSDHQCQPADGTTAPAAISTGEHSTGALVADVTVDAIDPGNGADGDSRGVSLYSGGDECLRCNVFGFSKDFLLDGSSSGRTLLQDSYGHDLADDWSSVSAAESAACPHENVIFDDSSSYVTIEHSYAIGTGAGYCITGAIDDLGDYGAFGHDVVDSSYAEGVDGADMYTGRSGNCGTPFQVTNNALSNDNGYNGTDTINYWTDTGNRWSGNYVPEFGLYFLEPPTSVGC
jgi:hypothetical protein